MKVAYICMDYGVPIFGQKGCSVHVQEVIRSFLKLGIEVDLFASNLRDDVPLKFDKVRLHEFPVSKKLDRAEREKMSYKINDDLRKALDSEGQFDFVYERYSLWCFAGMEYAKDNNLPSVLEVNAPLIEEQDKHRGIIDRTTANRVALRVFKTAHTLIAVSQEVARYVKNFYGVNREVHVVPNGINPDRFPEKVEPLRPAKRNTLTIGFVGTLKPWHGLHNIIEAFAQVYSQNKGVRLLIVGDGPEKDNILSGFEANNLLEFVELTGAVSPSKIPGFLASMDIAVAPYPNIKNFYFSPLKIYEYMAAGLPVITSSIGQLKELIHDGKNGMLVPPDNPKALSNALLKLLQNSKLRYVFGKNARSFAFKYHAWDSIVMRILNLCSIKISEKVYPLKGS